MKVDNIAGYKSINAFVENKLQTLEQSQRSFASLFELMFSEKENILFEKSEGYRIVKTTYGQAYEEVHNKAALLRKLLADVRPDAVVGIYMQNSVEWIEVFWAVLAAGFRPLLMNLRLDTGLLEEALSQLDAAAVISDDKEFSVRTILADALEESKKDGGSGRDSAAASKKENEDGFSGRDSAAASKKENAGGFSGKDSAFASKKGNIDGSVDGANESVFGTEILVMSSGTSEHIRICAYSAEEFYYLINDSYQIIKNSRLIKKHYEGELKLLTFLPFYHVFGLIAVYVWFAFFSRTFVQLNDMAPATIINTIRRHKVTHIFAVPMFWEKVYEQAVKTIKERGDATYRKFQKGLAISEKVGAVPGFGDWFKKKIFAEVRTNLFGESICFMITGGSSIENEVLRFFNGIGYHLANGYGMTEIGITSVELSEKDNILCSGSVGSPFSSVAYRVSEDGELLVKGKTAAKYILEDGKKLPKEEWFHTRDLAEERNGRYLIKGRMDDVVISSSGENLNPNVVEPNFRLPDVRNACLIGEKLGEKKLPVLILSVNRYLSPQRMTELDEQIKKRLNELNLGAQISKVVYTDDSLLEENNFKLKRAAISRKYAAGQFHLLTPGEASMQENEEDNEVLEKIRRIYAAVLNIQPEDISYSADFFLDCGGSSLDYFALCAELQNEFGKEISVSEGDKLRSIRDFYNYIIE